MLYDNSLIPADVVLVQGQKKEDAKTHPLHFVLLKNPKRWLIKLQQELQLLLQQEQLQQQLQLKLLPLQQLQQLSFQLPS